MATITFIDKAGTEKVVEAELGLSILEIAHRNHIPLEGACEGSLACSTCHVIVDEKDYAKLPAASDVEEDMLDLAFGLTQTSRLGCQLIMSKNYDGMRLRLPSSTRNMRVDKK
jgi:2Fe-2S ferredoxin